MARNFIYVEQAEIGRWRYGDASYGLCTEGFYTCLIVALRAKNRISLIHMDVTMSLKHIKPEWDWVGQAAEAFIFYKENEDAEEFVQELFERAPQERERFTFIKIAKLLDSQGKSIPCSTGTMLTKNTPLPAFEKNIVWLSQDCVMATKADPKGFNVIFASHQIKSQYHQLQPKYWGSGIRTSQQPVLQENFLQAVLANDVVFVKESIAVGKIAASRRIVDQNSKQYNLLSVALKKGYAIMFEVLLKENLKANHLELCKRKSFLSAVSFFSGKIRQKKSVKKHSMLLRSKKDL